MPRDDFSKIDEEYFNTVLDEDFNFEGSIKHEESLVIKGVIKGKIETQGDLIIGPNAVVEADISSKNLQCFGRITGNINVLNEVFFHGNSIIHGNVTAPFLEIEKGCVLNGQVLMVVSQNK